MDGKWETAPPALLDNVRNFERYAKVTLTLMFSGLNSCFQDACLHP